MVVGVHSAGEKGSAVEFSGVSALPDGGGAGEAVQLLGGAARAVGGVGVLAVARHVVEHQVVLAGHQPLNAARTIDILVAGVGDSPLAVQALAVPCRLWLLELGSATTEAVNLEGKSALLA